jgi:hypothetical protein
MAWVSMVASGLLIGGLVAGVRAATVPVRDNIDEFIGDLHRQGRWAAIAASLAAVGGLLEQALKLL